MKRLLVLAALVASGTFLLQDISTGHGGTYRGPGDTVPPGGGGHGGGPPPGPTGGSPPGPSTGSPGVPTGPTGSGPGVPTGGAPARPVNAGTGSIPGGPDLTTWESWWGFNKDQYLQLKAAIFHSLNETSDFFGVRTKHTRKPSEETIRGQVVPALKAALAKERSNDIVTGALVALAKIGDVRNGDDGSSELQPIISAFLSDPNQEIAETAAVALGILANDASVDALRQLAQDTAAGRRLVGTTEVHYRTRAFATYGLGLIGHRTARNEVRQTIARTLIDILEKPDSATRDLKVAAVVALGLVPIDADQSTPDGAGATDHCASRQSEIRYLALLGADSGQHSSVRAQVPTALARLLGEAPESQRDEVANSLVQRIGEFSKEREQVQQSCILALGLIGTTSSSRTDVEIRRALVKVVKEKLLDLQSRNFCTIALAQIGGRGSTPGSGAVRDEIRSFLLGQLTQGPSHIKPWAGIAVGVMERALVELGNTTPVSVKETIHAAFKDARAPELVGALAISLGIAQDSTAEALVTAKLGDTADATVQGYLCVSLGLMDARSSIQSIRTFIGSSKYKPELLRQAAIGLGLMGDEDLVPELVTMLGEAQGLASQAAIASALGFIGDSRSIAPLIAMLRGERGVSATARGFAAVALGIVGDKEMLPWNCKISTNINYLANTPTLTGAGTGILDIL